MKSSKIILLFLLLSACAGTQKIPAHGVYVSSMGKFPCRDYPLGAEVEEALGPHGGTIRIRDIARVIRFDLEEFEPALEPVLLPLVRHALHEGYFTQQTLPLIKTASPAVQVLEAKMTTLEKPLSLAGLPVYQSAVLMPESNVVRGQVQYSDGHFMYTMSSLATVQPSWTQEQQVEAAYEQLLLGLSWCHFPSLEVERH